MPFQDAEQTNNTVSYPHPSSIHNLHSPIQGHLPVQQLPMRVDLQSDMSSMDQLKQYQPLLAQRPPIQPQALITNQQQNMGHDYTKVHNHTQKPVSSNTDQSLSMPEGEAQLPKPAQQKTNQSGQALETLRALALAQEEQVRKLKQDKEQASQFQHQLKLGAGTSQRSEANAPSAQAALSLNTTVHGTQPVASSKPIQLPAASLRLPITDPKVQGGKQNSVLQLRGQIVRTSDQKLMLVTEVAGKKVGYLIGQQPGQLQASNASIASQLITKASQGIGQGQSQPKQMTPSPISSPSSPSLNIVQVSNHQERTIPEHSKTVVDSVDENSNDSRQPFSKEVGSAVSSDEDLNSVADVSLGLKNASLDDTNPVKKKRRGKPKKKKDKNEPVKPVLPYWMFFKDTQPSVRQQHPGASLGDVSKMVSKLWEQSSKEEKQVYLDRYAKAKEEYEVKLAEYKASIAAHISSPVDQASNPNQLNAQLNASAAASDASLSAESYSRNAPIVVSSSDSSPEGSSGTTKPVVAASAGEASMDVDAPLSGGPQLEDRHSDASSPSEEPIIRKRGRPKLSKNKKPPKVPKSKKQKKTERLEPQEPEKMKLTMKINIRDSKITESPTRAFADVEDCSVDEKQQNAEVEGVNEKELNEKKPSTQPVALVGFKIPKKRKASVEDIKGTSDRPPKPASSGLRKCSRPNCEKAAKINKERGPSYCSDECLVLHCRSVFDIWVDGRKKKQNED